jgi:hypothetical protein
MQLCTHKMWGKYFKQCINLYFDYYRIKTSMEKLVTEYYTMYYILNERILYKIYHTEILKIFRHL